MEGKQTKEMLEKFNPLFILRYSATHKKDSIYNMVYRLDALDAYNKKLVKKIAVKGISVTGSTSTEGYVYLQGLDLSQNKAPVALVEFEFKGTKGIRRVLRKLSEKSDLYDKSGQLEQYKNGYVISKIDGRDNSVSFVNGVTLYAGDVIGVAGEDELRAVQIRETILSHLERERFLYDKGIKVLSLFFIDEVAKYRMYDDKGNVMQGEYAEVFAREYLDIVKDFVDDSAYGRYLEGIVVEKTHTGYFSIDKNNRFTDSKINNRKENTTDDQNAYDLIMRDKERLLSLEEPVRFIFSHSALREGWDNPNVFQICVLKQSSSDIRKRQEVGRGLRLCVNAMGERIDGEDVHDVNVLTVVANESYDSFTKALQSELAEDLVDRAIKIDKELFYNRIFQDDGQRCVIGQDEAEEIVESLIVSGYIKKSILTDKYFEDINDNSFSLPEELRIYESIVLEILSNVYNEKALKIENALAKNVSVKLREDKLEMQEFKKLWQKINSKSFYTVAFDSKELVVKAVAALNAELTVSEVMLKVEVGTIDKIKSKKELEQGGSFVKDEAKVKKVKELHSSQFVKYDLIGKLAKETGLTRLCIVEILKAVKKEVFEQFKINPEEFIVKAGNIINEQKATVIIEHITYNKLQEVYSENIFTSDKLKGNYDLNVIGTKKHLYDHVIYDSQSERDFAQQLDVDSSVAVYVKLPKDFYINTPVGKYNPDWAIAFYEGAVKHIYFVAETKGSMSSMQLRKIEEAKIYCAKEHFSKISGDDVRYEVVDSYGTLLNKVMK